MIDVRTSNGETKRSVHNVCPFPIDDNDIDHDKAGAVKTIPVMKNNGGSVESATSIKDKGRKFKAKDLFLYILFMLTICNPVKSQVEVTNFEDRAGVFFEEVVAVGLTKSSWNIVAHVKMTEYTSGIKALDEAVKKFNEDVMRIPEMKQLKCIQRLQEAHDRMRNQHDVIMSSAPVQRIRRSAVPFVGSIFRSLFGLMDEEHADDLVKRITMVEDNQKSLVELLDNQTSLQDITTRIIKEQNQAVFTNIANLDESLGELSKKIDEINRRESVAMKATEALSAIQDVEIVQRDLIEAMVNVRGSFLHEILPVKVFKQQIQVIKSSIGRRLHLPTESPIELAKIADVSTRTTEEYMLFNIRIPLINTDQFTAYAIQSYPVVQDGLSVQLKAHSNYLLIDEKKTTFYALTEDDFARCQKMDRMIICQQLHPIYNTREATECEVRLFLKPNQMPESCDFAITKFHNFWKQLRTPNMWVFSVTSGTVTEVKCGGKRQNTRIRNQGLLRMQPGCTLETEEMKLWAHENYRSEVNYVFPQFNISASLPSLTHLSLKNKIEVYKLPDIPQVKRFLGFPVHLDTHHLMHYSLNFTTCLFIAGIIIALYLVIRRLYHLSSRYLPVSIALPQIR